MAGPPGGLARVTDRGVTRYTFLKSALAGDPLEEEGDLHQRFLESRGRLYVPRPAIDDRLDDYARGDDDHPCLVVGPPGSGKSASLARFVARFEARHRDDPHVFVLPHFVGASARSTNLGDVLGRLCGVLKRRFGFEAAIPDGAQGRARLFLGWLASIPSGVRLVLALDALNQLDEADGAYGLRWLPERLLPHVKVVASCVDDRDDPRGPHPLWHALRERPALRVGIEPLSDEARRAIIREVPKVAAKTLDERQVGLLLDNPATANPLFLLVALEELRGFGSFERLTERIKALPDSGDTVTAVFEQVFERLEQEFDAGFVGEVLTLLACARRGLTERELRALTASRPRREDLFPVLRQLRPYLLSRAGLLNYYHANVTTAVRRRYLGSGEKTREVHGKLAQYFAAQPLNGRKVEELPWHYVQLQDWGALARLLADLPFVEAALRADQSEVGRYWAQVEANSPWRMVDAYRRVLEAPAEFLDFALELAGLLHQRRHWTEALALFRRLEEVGRRRGFPAAWRLACLTGQGGVLQDQGRSAEAMGPLRDAMQVAQEGGNREVEAHCLVRQAEWLQRSGDAEGALELLQTAEAIARQLGERLILAGCLLKQASLLLLRSELDQALARAREGTRLSRQLHDPSGLVACLHMEHLVLKARGDLGPARGVLQEIERLCGRIHDLPGLSQSLVGQADIEEAQGRPEAALGFLVEAEKAFRRLGDAHGLVSSLVRQASILQDRNDLEAAWRLWGEAEQLFRQLNQTSGLLHCRLRRAAIREAQQDLQGALQLLTEAGQFLQGGGDYIGTWAPCLVRRASLLNALGRNEEALQDLQTAGQLCRQSNDLTGLVHCLFTEGTMLREGGKLEEALGRFREAETVSRTFHDADAVAKCTLAQAQVLQALHRPGSVALLEGLKDTAPVGAQHPLRLLAEISEARDRLSRARDLAERGDAEKALELLREAEAVYRGVSVPAELAALLPPDAAQGELAGLATCLALQAEVLLKRGDQAGALAAFQEVAELCERMGQPARRALFVTKQADILHARGDLEGAVELYKQAEQLCRRTNDLAGLAGCLAPQARILRGMGDWDCALVLFQELEQLYRKMDNRSVVAIWLGAQARVLLSKGEAERAAACVEEAEHLFREAGDSEGLADCLVNRAEVLQTRGDLDTALALLSQAEQLYARFEAPFGLARCLGNRGLILQRRGNLDAAARLFKRQEQLCRQLENWEGLVISLTNQAGLLAEGRGQPQLARNLAEDALRIARKYGLAALARQTETLLDSVGTLQG